jgi:hypothetical protein
MLLAASTLLPNGPGDVWSIAFAAIAFTLLFLFIKLLERV